MNKFRTLPIQKKLIFIILAITVPTLFLSGSFFIYNNLKTFKEEMVRNLTVLASAVGATSRAALVFEDDTAAEEILTSLKEENQILSAALYDENDKVFVVFTPDEVTSFKAPTLLETGKHIYADRIEIVLPVTLEGEEVGKIYIHAHLREFDARIKNYMIYAGMTLMSILALAFGFTLKLQKIISKPILNLAILAKKISQTSDYSIRVEEKGDAEIGTLVSGFNEMLSQIEKREKDLAINQDQLEKSETSVRTILDNAFDAIITIDAEGVITNWNQRASSIFGWQANDAIGRKLSELIIPTQFRDAHTSGMARFLSTGENEILNQQIEISGLHRDGHSFPVEISVSETKVDESYIFTGIIRDITQRKQAERELIGSRERLRNLNNQLQSVREEEKTRIAREIHDELGQALTALKFDVSWMGKKNSNKDPMVIEKTKSMKDLIENTIRVVQRIATELRPQMLDIMGLCETLKWQSEEFQKRSGVICELKIEPDEIIVDPARSTALFRIYQEALTNVARHAKAKFVHTSLTRQENSLVLIIMDNGIGMDEKTVDNPHSLGLIGIRERVLIWRGKFDLRSIQGKGTTLTITIPSNDPHSNAKK